MKILILTPDPATPLKPRVFRFAKLLSTTHEVYVAFVNELYGRRVPSAIRRAAERELQDLGVKLLPISASWSYAVPSVLRNLWRRLPLRVALYDRDEMRRQVSAVVDKVCPDLIHVDRERAYALASDLPHPMVVDLTDPVGWYLERRAGMASEARAKLLRLESERVWTYERNITQRVSGVLFASDFGAEMFRGRFPETRAHVIPVPLPTRPLTAARETGPPRTSPRICFFGNLHYQPNVHGIVNFVRHCWQTVRAHVPSATLHIAGSHPRASVRKLGRSEGVFIHDSPADMSDFLRTCDLSIAPIQLCAGFPNKIVDAVMEGGLPVVATPEAMAGLPPRVRECLPTASEPEEWAAQLKRLWLGADERRETVHDLREAIQQSLAPEHLLVKLNSVYELAVGGR